MKIDRIFKLSILFVSDFCGKMKKMSQPAEWLCVHLSHLSIVTLHWQGLHVLIVQACVHIHYVCDCTLTGKQTDCQSNRLSFCRRNSTINETLDLALSIVNHTCAAVSTIPPQNRSIFRTKSDNCTFHLWTCFALRRAFFSCNFSPFFPYKYFNEYIEFVGICVRNEEQVITLRNIIDSYAVLLSWVFAILCASACVFLHIRLCDDEWAQTFITLCYCKIVVTQFSSQMKRICSFQAFWYRNDKHIARLLISCYNCFISGLKPKLNHAGCLHSLVLFCAWSCFLSKWFWCLEQFQDHWHDSSWFVVDKAHICCVR